MHSYKQGMIANGLKSRISGKSSYIRRFQNLISAIVVFLALTAGTAVAQSQLFMTIGTGGVTGIYYPAGNAICRSINKTRSAHGLRCAAEPGRGSIGNLEALRSGKIDFAILQGDWLHHAFTGTAVFRDKGPYEDLRTVFELHTEMATIVVRENSEIRRLEDLKEKRLNIGPPGSGSAATWQRIADLAGWTETDHDEVERLDISGLGELLCSGSIDAYFVFIGHPAGVLEDTRDQCRIRLIGIDDEMSSMMADNAPYYKKAEIPAGLYGLKAPVPTFGAPALVVTTKKAPTATVTTFVRSVLTQFSGFQSAHPALAELKKADMAAPKTMVPLHRGAFHFFHEQGYLPN